MSKILKIDERNPVTCVMDGKRGIAGEPCESQWGESQWKHWVNNDANLIYLPAAAQKKLEASGAQEGDTVTIEKLRRGIFRVSVHEPEPYINNRHEMYEGAELKGKVAGKNVTNGANALAPRMLNEHEEHAEEARATDPEPYTRPQPQRANTRATQAIHQQIATAATICDLARPEAKLMAGALTASIDAFAWAKNYADDKGLTFDPKAEDIRAFAISAYINASKGAR